MLIRHGYKDCASRKPAVRRPLQCLNRLIGWRQWPTAFRPWPPRGGEEASCRLCSAQPGHVGPVHAFNTLALARIAPALPISLFWLLLHHSAASEHPPRHCRRSCSVEITSAHCRSIRQSVVLVAPSPPSPPFPPCSAHDFAFGKPCLALRRRGYALTGVPPWPLPWPCLIGTASAV